MRVVLHQYVYPMTINIPYKGHGIESLRYDISILKNVLQGHDSYVSSVCVFHDNKFIISGANDNTVKIRDINTKQYEATLQGHGSYVASV